jgi:alanine racemase
MTLRTQVIALQQLEPGDTVGYGNTFTAEYAMRIGVVACGYADGYPRHAPSGTPVLVDGARTQTVGRVSMDMITVDLSALPHAGVWTEVTLWGCGPRDSVLPIDEVALPAQTVAYELMCALAPRVPVRIA